jgi:hypothetical protein
MNPDPITSRMNRRLIALAALSVLVWALATMLISLAIAGSGPIKVTTADDLQGLINVTPGGEFELHGNFAFRTRLVLNNNVKLRGVGDGTITFVRPTGGFADRDSNAYGLEIPAGSNGVEVTGLTLRSNVGICWLRPGTNATKFRNNDLKWGDIGNGYNRLAWFGEFGADGQNGLVIENNTIHDSPNANRVLEIYKWRDGSYSWNRFNNVSDGGHVMDFHGRLDVRGNVFTKMHRMCLEVQDPCQDGVLNVLNNVAYDFALPYNDTFPWSFMGRQGKSCDVGFNYVRSDFTGPWGAATSPGNENRFGIPFECEWGEPPTFDPKTGQLSNPPQGVVHDNVVGGPNRFASLISAGARAIQAKNNTFYGAPLWGLLMGETGFFGNGYVQDLGGNVTRPAGEMPGPEAFIAAIGHPVGAQIGEPQPPSVAPSNLRLALLPDPNYVLASWTNNTATSLNNRVDVVSSVGREKLKSTLTLGGVSSAPVLVHQGWKLDFTVTAVTPAGEFTSAPVTAFQAAGDSLAPYPPPTTQPSTQPTPDPAVVALQAKLDAAAATHKPVVNDQALTLSVPLRVPSGIDFTVGTLTCTAKGPALLITGDAPDGKIHDGSIEAKGGPGWDFDGNPQEMEFHHLDLNTTGTHVNLKPKGDGFSYFTRVDHVFCRGTGEIARIVGRGVTISNLRAVNNHFTPDVQAMVTVEHSTRINPPQGSTVHFAGGSQLESSSGIPLLQISGWGNFVEVAGLWWEQKGLKNADGTTLVIPKVIVDGAWSALVTSAIAGMNPNQPVVIRNGASVQLTTSPLLLNTEGTPFPVGSPGFNTLAPKCVIGDGTGELRYAGGTIKAAATQPQQ